MKWLSNLKNLIDNGSVGKCPHCNSYNTDYSVSVVDESVSMGYMDLWCEDCRKASHISRMKIPKGLRHKDVPRGLILTN